MAEFEATMLVSRLSFMPDMTKVDGQSIPLGVMLEAAWDDEARWLGLIFRTQLTSGEIAGINMVAWPELSDPSEFMTKLFDEAWGSSWGSSGAHLAQQWSSSSLLVTSQLLSEAAAPKRIETEADWERVSELLRTQLNLFGSELRPLLPISSNNGRRKASTPTGPLFINPRETRMREASKIAA